MAATDGGRAAIVSACIERMAQEILFAVRVGVGVVVECVTGERRVTARSRGEVYIRKGRCS